MEPTIYKPGAYKSPGIYNGAGGVYNGRGVYNDGAGGGETVLYDTDFSSLNLDSGEDTNGALWTITNKSNIQKTTRNIDGVERPVLRLSNAANLTLNINDLLSYDEDFTIESIVYPISQGLALSYGVSTCNWCVNPTFNGYSYRSNKILMRINYVNNITTLNGFYNSSEDFYLSTLPEFTGIYKIITAGMSKKGDDLKFYSMGKKAIKANKGSSTINSSIYCVANASFDVIRFRIVKNADYYEQME